MRAWLIPTWLQEWEVESDSTKTWRRKMRIGITVGFMAWKREFYFGAGSGKFKIVELSGTVLGAEVSIFVKVG